MGKGFQWVEGQREGAKARGGRQEAGAGAESTGSDPTWGARQEVEAGQPGSQLCKETFPWGGGELGWGTLGFKSFLTPGTRLAGPEGATRHRLPSEECVAPSLSLATAVDSPRALTWRGQHPPACVLSPVSLPWTPDADASPGPRVTGQEWSAIHLLRVCGYQATGLRP